MRAEGAASTPGLHCVVFVRGMQCGCSGGVDDGG